VPFLDHKLVEFVATIPSKLKLKGWEKKHILIQSLKGILPDPILRRRKQGFSIPLGAWMKGPLRELLHDILSRDAMKETRIVNPDFVATLIDEHDRGLSNHETKLWALTVFIVWYKTYLAGQ
jgi:asparagine synthase (glutamine-hydrolysing)